MISQEYWQAGMMLFKMIANTNNERTPSIFRSSDKAVELGPHSFAHCANSHSMQVENGAHSLGISSLWRSREHLVYPGLWDLQIASPAQPPNLTVWYGLWDSAGLWLPYISSQCERHTKQISKHTGSLHGCGIIRVSAIYQTGWGQLLVLLVLMW